MTKKTTTESCQVTADELYAYIGMLEEITSKLEKENFNMKRRVAGYKAAATVRRTQQNEPRVR